MGCFYSKNKAWRCIFITSLCRDETMMWIQPSLTYERVYCFSVSFVMANRATELRQCTWLDVET